MAKTAEQVVKDCVLELLKEKGTIAVKRANFRNLDFNFEELLQVYPNAESLTLENGEIIAVNKAAPKMVKVIGNTYEVKGILKQYGFEWNAKEKAWFGSEDKKDAMINELPKTFESTAKSQILALEFEVVNAPEISTSTPLSEKEKPVQHEKMSMKLSEMKIDAQRVLQQEYYLNECPNEEIRQLKTELINFAKDLLSRRATKAEYCKMYDMRKAVSQAENTAKNNAWGGAREGAGRPAETEEKKKPRNFKATDAEWKAIQEKAQASGMNASEYIRAKTLDKKEGM